MLNYLKVTDFALIADAEVEFSPRFNVITGESGSGKSLLMSALSQLLSPRANHSAIRTGAVRSTVTGIFTLPEKLLLLLKPELENAGITIEDNTLTLRRVISASSTRNFINDTPVGAKLLSQTAAELLDLHAVNEHLSLTSPIRQLALLDKYAGLEDLLSRCREKFLLYGELQKEKTEFISSLPDEREARQLSRMVEDISAVSPQAGEDEALDARHRVASHAREVLSTISQLTGLLNDDENSIADQLGEVYRKLSGLAKIDESTFAGILTDCANLQEDTAALSRKIENLSGSVELDPAELEEIENRLSAIYQLKRRYAPDIEQILQLETDARSALKARENAQEHLQMLDNKAQAVWTELEEICSEISTVRRERAEAFAREVSAKLSAIGFKNAVLKPALTAAPISANGQDQLELLFSANQGEELRPLRKIASSGELSRLMLALKTVLADADEIPTVIFDEIDMNIGGEAANAVGNELSMLGQKHQIISISHLAQVASRADLHIQISKTESGGRTSSTVQVLEDPVPELARMLGNGPAALEHARSLRQN